MCKSICSFISNILFIFTQLFKFFKAVIFYYRIEHRIIKESVKQVIRESRDLNFYNPWLNGEASYFRGKYDINGYHVEIDELYNILIQNGEDEYFLQGDEADDLIYDMCLAWKNNPNKSKEEIIYAFIQQY